jgi:hypothetical protein
VEALPFLASRVLRPFLIAAEQIFLKLLAVAFAAPGIEAS